MLPVLNVALHDHPTMGCVRDLHRACGSPTGRRLVLKPSRAGDQRFPGLHASWSNHPRALSICNANGGGRLERQACRIVLRRERRLFCAFIARTSGSRGIVQIFWRSQGRRLPMHMAWHTLVFDPEKQNGAGEYTFRYRKQTHGVVMVKISNGLIVNWREYEVESELPWDQFVGDNRF